MTTEPYNEIEPTTDKAFADHLARFGVNAGTLHVVVDSQYLRLCASFNIPSDVQCKIKNIPRGKGLAGLAWLERRIVSTCDLATDTKVESGARTLPFKSSFAIPIFRDSVTIGVLGVAFLNPTEISESALLAMKNLPKSLEQRLQI